MATAETCDICRRIARLTPDNPYFVAELETGYAVLGDHQIYRGYTVFVAKRCVGELHLLPLETRTRFLEEMALVSEAVFRAFSPRKLNYELLGNSVPHLHWHLFPRHDDDPNPTWPVWNNPDVTTAATSRAAVDPALLAELREQLRAALTDVRER